MSIVNDLGSAEIQRYTELNLVTTMSTMIILINLLHQQMQNPPFMILQYPSPNIQKIILDHHKNQLMENPDSLLLKPLPDYYTVIPNSLPSKVDIGESYISPTTSFMGISCDDIRLKKND